MTIFFFRIEPVQTHSSRASDSNFEKTRKGGDYLSHSLNFFVKRLDGFSPQSNSFNYLISTLRIRKCPRENPVSVTSKDIILTDICLIKLLLRYVFFVGSFEIIISFLSIPNPSTLKAVTQRLMLIPLISAYISIKSLQALEIIFEAYSIFSNLHIYNIGNFL